MSKEPLLVGSTSPTRRPSMCSAGAAQPAGALPMTCTASPATKARRSTLEISRISITASTCAAGAAGGITGGVVAATTGDPGGGGDGGGGDGGDRDPGDLQR